MEEYSINIRESYTFKLLFVVVFYFQRICLNQRTKMKLRKKEKMANLLKREITQRYLDHFALKLAI